MATSSCSTATKRRAEADDEPEGGKKLKSEEVVDLVDDCWLIAFANLDVFDLINVANTCVRFRNLVHQHIRPSHLRLEPRQPPVQNLADQSSKKFQRVIDRQTKEIIKLFGPTAKVISVDMRQYAPSFFEAGSALASIKEWCPDLETFRMYNFTFAEYPIYSNPDSDSDSGSGLRRSYELDYSITGCPPIAKHIVIEDSFMPLCIPFFRSWRNCAQSITLKNVTLSSVLVMCMRRLFKQVRMRYRESKSYKRAEQFKITEALFRARE